MSQIPKPFRNLDLSDLPTSNPGGGKPWLNGGALWVGDATVVTPVITVQPSNATVTEGDTATFTITATDATAYQWQIQQSGVGAWSSISGATSSSYTTGVTEISADDGDKYRCIVTGVGASVTSNSATLTVALIAPPAAIVDYWRFGSTMLKSGDIPITSAGDALTKWVGGNGTVLTASSITAQLADGLLTAKNNAGGNFALPGGFASARTDFSIFLHIQRPECYQTRAYCGFGATRQLDISNFGTIANLVSNGASNTTYESTGRASTFTLSLRSNGSGLKLGINGVEITKTAFTAASMTGGRLLSLFDGSVMSSDRIWAAAIGPYLNDADFNQTIEWCQSVRPIPSETAPTYNIVVFGDSQTSGLNAGGHSWMLDMADTYDARIIPIVGSATYFAAGATPQNRSQNLTQLDLEHRPSAGRNIIIVGTSNDLDQGTGAGQAYADAIVTSLGPRLSNWQVYVARQPVRAAPYVPVASFNTERSAFNAAIVSDGWTGLIDWSDLTSDSDGIHWPSSQQTVAFNRVVSALGLV